jgi:diguanylate cyclase (GGDEF)-like protein
MTSSAAPKVSFASRMRSAKAARRELDAAVDLESYKLLVASLFSSPTSIVVSNIVGAAVPFFCWVATNEWMFLAIGLIACAAIVLRFATVRRYVSMNHVDETLADVKRWDREYFIGATVYSTILGLNCFAALALTQNTAAHMITVVSAIAFSSGYVARNAGRPNFVVIQLMCFCLPMAAGLFVSGQPYFAGIGVFIVLYVLTNISIVFSINRNLLALADANKRSRSLAETTRRQNLMLDSALNSMTHGLMMFDPALRLEVQNSRHMELYGLARETVGSGATLQEALAALVAAGTITDDCTRLLGELSERCLLLAEPGHLEFVTRDQKTFVVAVEPTADGGVLITTEDATARRQIAAQFERMARYDALTGLANRFTLNRALDSACANGAGNGHPAVLYIDVDNFKTVNDSMGHEWGDKLLIQVADRLRALAGPADTVARFGGDEFVWLRLADPSEKPADAGKRVVGAMAHPFDIDGTLIYVTTSVGIALVPEHGRMSADILRAADIALYAAKQAGRNTASMFDPVMEDGLRARRELEIELRQACRSRSLSLHYQPIIDLRTGHVASCEALMRWNHPTRGMVSPVEFIPVAEQTGLISEMGDWAIEQACLDAAAWPDDIAVAVNVSAFQFKDPARLIRAVKHALKLSGLSPQRLELEVTESLLIEDQKTTLRTIQALRRIGVKFSLDDFGVGYSSLAYLAEYPFSKVKIDRSFAKDITSNGPSRSIIETVCRLARDLGLIVVVEGIETEAQQREAEKLGIEFGQGYLFGRPAAAEVHIRRITKAA